MNPEVKEKWLQALRSGEYQQGYGQLRFGDEFCCLGVLCDIHSKEKLGVWERGDYGGNYEFLPEGVQLWAGLIGGSPDLKYNGIGYGLTELNDESELSFKEISNLIEEQL